jgi:phenylacetate-CoA ligase
MRQLEALVRHAAANVPFYAARLRTVFDAGGRFSSGAYARLPLLTRAELQSNFDALASRQVPPSHGRMASVRTSGSTGQPVQVIKTELAQRMWEAMLLREHRWFDRDLNGKLAVIRQGVKEVEADGWGPISPEVVRTGRVVTLPISRDVASQLAWLERQQPDYLLTYPSNVAELARLAIARGVQLPRLREVRTFGELLPTETRELCRQAWSTQAVDVYSSVETGYLALQCPAAGHYHVQAEGVFLEVLDGNGSPCAPGETGRIVVTPLHNFAMPLLRYDIADYATVGARCPCGRGLPVLQRIVGRVRNMLVTADGKRYWPTLGTRAVADAAPIRQYQLVQKAFDRIEVRLVAAQRLDTAQEEKVCALLQSRLPAGFQFSFVYCDVIAAGAGGKFEDFISEVVPPRN